MHQPKCEYNSKDEDKNLNILNEKINSNDLNYYCLILKNKIFLFILTKVHTVQLTGAVEYTDCISTEG